MCCCWPAYAAPAILCTDIEGAQLPTRVSWSVLEGELGGTGSNGTVDVGSSGRAACPASELAALA